MPSKQPTWTLRFPDTETIESLKDEHAKTYPEHRMSFNAWLLARILKR